MQASGTAWHWVFSERKFADELTKLLGSAALIHDPTFKASKKDKFAELSTSTKAAASARILPTREAQRSTRTSTENESSSPEILSRSFQSGHFTTVSAQQEQHHSPEHLPEATHVSL